MKLTHRFILMTAMGVVCLWAQKSGAPSGGTSGGKSGGTTTGTGGGTGTSPTQPANPPIGNPAPTTQTPVAAPPKSIYLSGKVMVDDGSPLPVNVNIQSICGGTRQRTVAHTSSAGDFGFMWGDTASVFEDASESVRNPGGNSGSGSGTSGGGYTIDPLADCDLRADASGYTSSNVSLYQHKALDNFDVGAIVLHRITGNEGRVVSLLALKAPKDAKKNFDKGTEQMRANKLTDAAASFQKSVTGYPQYADAWLSLGRVQSQLGAKDVAREDFQKAMDLDDKLVGPWQELGYMACDQSKWEDAARYLDKAVQLDPMSSPMAWYFSAMANYNLGRFEQAEHSVRAEMKLDKNPGAEYVLGLVLIARKDYKGGAEALRTFVASSPKSEEADIARKQLSRIESALGQ